MWPDLGAVRDGIIFNLLNMMGGILWTLDRIMLMVSSILHWFRVLLVGGGGQDNLLGILMTQLLQGNELLKQLVYLGLMLAFTVMSFTLIARPLIGRFQAVDFQKVILWLFIAVLIFSAGPGMVAGLEGTRLGLQEQAHLIASTIQYQNEVNRFNNQVVPNTVGDFWLPGQTPGYVPHLFGTAVGSDCSAGCNGLDAAAAFLGAEEGDITGARAEARNTGGYPQALYSRYFTWRDGNEEERAASLRNAADGVMRLLEGALPSFFSIIEALIFLLFGIAAMVLFISLPIAIPFAFFSLTEIIAASVLRAYIFLVLRTFVVATMMAFLVQMLIIFAERGTVLVFVSIAALTMILSFQFVGLAASTVTGALNVIGSAVGSASGMSARQVDPFAAAGRVAGMAALAGAAVATGGGAMVGAATLLHRQGGLRGGGLSAVGSAALHAARVRAGAVVGRTPLGGLQRGYNAVHGYHRIAREHAYQMESARALLLDRDAEEAAAVVMEQKNVSPARKEWAAKKVQQWTSVEQSRQKYRTDMREAGMSRLAYRGYSRPWKALNLNGAASPAPSPAHPGPHPPGSQPTSGSVGPSPRKVEDQDSTIPARDSSPGEHDMPSHAPGAPAASGATAASAIQNVLNDVGAKGGSEIRIAEINSGQLNRSASRASKAGVTRQPARSKHGMTGDPLVTTIFPFNAGDPALRASVGDAVLMENRAVGVVSGYLVVYSGAPLEDDHDLGRYDILPAGTDITNVMDLLRSGKHIQQSHKRQGMLVSWKPDQTILSSMIPGLTSWSGTDSRVRRKVLAETRELADMTAEGLPITESALQGKLGHLSASDRQRLVGLLQGGRISPGGIVSVLEATNELADSMEEEGAGNTQALLDEFMGSNGYLDLSSPAVTSLVSAAASRGDELHIQIPGSPDTRNAADQNIDQDLRPADMALLISAGLGLKRALPWSQVKGALVQASLSDTHDAREPVQTVSESLAVPSLRTSMAPINRFVGTARSIGMSAADVSSILDVAASAHDIGEIVAGVPTKDETTRHTKWRAAGVPPSMLRPLDRVRSNVLQHAISLSPAGTSDHKAFERTQEMLGSLLVEGVTIRDELDSVHIETYSAHPFNMGGSGRSAAPTPIPIEQTPPPPASLPHAAQPRKSEKAHLPQGTSQSTRPSLRRRAHQAPKAPISPQTASQEGAVEQEFTDISDASGIDQGRPVTSDVSVDRHEETGGNDAIHQT